MKKILLACSALSLGIASFAQTDSTVTEKPDTIKIGGVIIIRKNGKNDTTGKTVVISNRKKNEHSKVSTNWWIADIGFANYNDNTDYSSAAAQSFAPGFDEDKLKLRTGKSVNVNVWLFMQRLRIVKGINLKYGLGLELNNYRFDDERVHFQENPTKIIFDESYKGLKKNKLAADYVTVPMMLNFNFTPDPRNGKLRDDFDLRKWKVSYIGELNLGVVRLYGSYAVKSMWEKGLDQTPYAIGVRFSYF
jgi:hypothetical protein